MTQFHNPGNPTSIQTRLKVSGVKMPGSPRRSDCLRACRRKPRLEGRDAVSDLRGGLPPEARQGEGWRALGESNPSCKIENLES